MNSGKLIFSQVMDFLPLHTFRRCVNRYQGNYQIKRFTCLDQYFCMAFAQLTYRESLRDIEACLRSQQHKLYHMGMRSTVSRSTLAEANEPFGVDLKQTVYALDATTIDLCLSLFPWASFRKSKSAVKLHTLLDLRGNIPTFIHISDGKLHDVNVFDLLPVEVGAFYIMDRGYLDYSRLHSLSQTPAFFVTRSKSNFKGRRLYSHTVDRTTGLICDQTILLTGFYSAKAYPDKLRRIKYHDAETDKTLIFLTNNFALPPLTIAQLYKCRWQVELFFKWIKQNLRIKSFYGTSENAVRTQIWIAISVYVLVAIIKIRLSIQISLYTMLQILSVTAFDRMFLNQLLTETDSLSIQGNINNQLNLFSS